jgi:hypothetical protein
MRFKMPFVLLMGFFAGAAGCAADPGESGEVAEAERASSFSPHDVLVTTETSHGAKLYDKHSVGWLAWAMGLPWSTGPVLDTTGAACAQGQEGSVWYLAGTNGGPVSRECTVPSSKPLFFPLVNRWAIPPDFIFETPGVLEAFFAFYPEYLSSYREATCGLTLSLDGVELITDLAEADATLYAETEEPVAIVMNDDNFGSPFNPGGVHTYSVVGGHWAYLNSLAPGDHVLEFSGTICDAGEVFFETSAVYTLHVVAPDDEGDAE